MLAFPLAFWERIGLNDLARKSGCSAKLLNDAFCAASGQSIYGHFLPTTACRKLMRRCR